MQSHRPSFARRVAAAVVSLLAIVQLSTAAHADQVVIKIGSIYPVGSPWATALKGLATKWMALSGGKVTLRLYLGGVVGSEPEIVDKVRIGQLHGGALSSDGLAYLAPDARVLDIPFKATSIAQEDTLITALAPTLEATFAKAGFVLAGQWVDGTTRLFSTKPAPDVATARTLKYFVVQEDVALKNVYAAMGFTPFPALWTDLVPSFVAGNANAVFLPVRTAAWLGLQTRASAMLDQTWSMATGGLAITKAAWESIPAELRPSLLNAVKQMAKNLTATADKNETTALAKMKAAGLKVTTAVDVPAWQQLVAAAPYRGTVVSAEIWDAMTQFLAPR